MRKIWLVIAVTLLAGCNGPSEQVPNNAQASEAEAGPVKGVDRSHKGMAAPDALFKDPDGGDINLATFRGAPLLVNLWATWCAPCVKELPTLNALSKSRRDDGALGVIVVSQDSAPQASVVAFLKTHKIDDLAAYHDPGMRLSGGLDAQILPTSVLYDAEGREVWRYIGDTDWTGAEAAKLLAEAN
ncbi:MAG: TlpA disulfide reductase family protein [Sphingomicrobium sp.]